MEPHETFLTLLLDPAHWEFELFLMFIGDFVIGAFFWPRFKRWTTHHQSDDEKLAGLERRVSAIEKRLQ